MKKSKRIHGFYLLLWILFLLIIFWFLQNYFLFLNNNLLVLLLLASNSSTFFLYGLDKMQAITSKTRVPEIILYLTALLGGSLGAILAMKLFRHKTIKASFQLVLSILILIQVFVLVYFLS